MFYINFILCFNFICHKDLLYIVMSNENKLKELLVKAYNEELESGMNYLSYGLSLNGVKGEFIGEKLISDVSEEFKHAEKIAKHLDVKFDHLVSNSKDFTSNQDFFYELEVSYRDNSSEVEEVVESVIEAESSAVDLYNEIIKVADNLGYHSTRDLAEELLADEEEHLDEFESLEKSL